MCHLAFDLAPWGGACRINSSNESCCCCFWSCNPYSIPWSWFLTLDPGPISRGLLHCAPHNHYTITAAYDTHCILQGYTTLLHCGGVRWVGVHGGAAHLGTGYKGTRSIFRGVLVSSAPNDLYPTPFLPKIWGLKQSRIFGGGTRAVNVGFNIETISATAKIFSSPLYTIYLSLYL